MVIRSPSPVFIKLAQEYGTIPSPWHQLQDLLHMMRTPGVPWTATRGGASPRESAGFIADWNRLDNRHLFSLFPHAHGISTYNTRQLIQWTEMKIRNTVPERHQNEFRQLAELLCTGRGPDTIQYYILQLFRLANNFDVEDDSIVIDQVEAIESKWPGKLKSLLELDNWVIRAAKGKIFASAVRRGKPAIIQAILEQGFNPNRVIKDLMDRWQERPAIYVAVGLKDKNMAVRIVQLFISCEHKLETNAQSWALHRAISMGRNAIANIFLQAEVPLHMPSLVRLMGSYHQYSNPGVQTWNIIKSLVASGALNRADLLSALKLAIDRGYLGITRGLLDTIVCRSDVADEHHLNGPGIKGLTSAEVAEAFQRVGAKEILLSAMENGCVDVVRQILDARADLLNDSHHYVWGQTTPLGLAVEDENLDLINFLLTCRGIDVNGLLLAHEMVLRNPWSGDVKIFTTPLGLAAWKGNLSIIQLLIQNGATPVDAFPLFAACYRGHAEIALALLKLERGFKAKEGDAYANTLRVPDKVFTALGHLEPLPNYTSCIGAFAAHFKDEDGIHQELLKHLIQEGARVDEGFLVAISYCNLALLKLLLPHIESTPFTWDDFGKTPLDVAVENGPLTIVELLVGAGFTELRNAERIYNIDALIFFERRDIPLVPAILKSNSGTSILSYAIQSQDWRLVEHLLRYDIDLNQPIRPSLSTPLELAVRLGDVRLVSQLLSRKALITAEVWTSLSYYPQVSNEVLKVLLSSLDQDKRHIKPDFDPEGQPLLEAVITKNHSFVKSFLKAECWNAEYLGISLTAAVLCNEHCLVQLLLEAGASLEEHVEVEVEADDELDIASSSPIEAAMKAENVSTFKALIYAAGTAIKGRIGYYVLCEGIESYVGSEYIDILLKAGADPNYGHSPGRDLNYGFTEAPIQIAARAGSLAILSLLIENGADVNVSGPYRSGDATALQFAAINGHLQMAELLLQNGADINAPAANYNGRTTLEGGAEHGRLEMVRFLLTREPKLKISGPYRIHFLRAVKLANKRGHKEVAEFLKLHGGWSESDERETEVNPRIIGAGYLDEWTGPGDEPQEMEPEGQSKETDQETVEVESKRPSYPAGPTATVQSEDGLRNSYQEVTIAYQEEREFQVLFESTAWPEALQQAADFNQDQPFQQLEFGHDMETRSVNFGDVDLSDGFEYQGCGYDVNAGGDLTMLESTSLDDESLFGQFLDFQAPFT